MEWEILEFDLVAKYDGLYNNQYLTETRLHKRYKKERLRKGNKNFCRSIPFLFKPVAALHFMRSVAHVKIALLLPVMLEGSRWKIIRPKDGISPLLSVNAPI